MKLFKHQIDALERTKGFKRVAYFHEMGTGKTFTGSEKLASFHNGRNLVICQKSKVADWIKHFEEYYKYKVYDLTKKNAIEEFIKSDYYAVGVINYDLLPRRDELRHLNGLRYTLMLDESSMIQNDKAKRTKAILRLNPTNVILLSGTPTSGKYENLYSQLQLLGLELSKELYWDLFIEYKLVKYKGVPFPLKEVTGYKNVDYLKNLLHKCGADFLKADESSLPSQNFSLIEVPRSKEYKKFMRDSYVEIDGVELEGDNALKKLLYARQLCGAYNTDKLNAFEDLINSTNDRLIVFYNFNNELEQLVRIAKNEKRPISKVNGSERDLEAYENEENSVTFIQYQAGAMGLNLQKAQHLVYFSLPLSSELYEQSKKRIHRIGQSKPCFYYILQCENSVEGKIEATLAMRRNFNERLFMEELECEKKRTKTK